MEVFSDTKFGISTVFMRFRHVNCMIFWLQSCRIHEVVPRAFESLTVTLPLVSAARNWERQQWEAGSGSVHILCCRGLLKASVWQHSPLQAYS
jgi:hypothetical protein